MSIDTDIEAIKQLVGDVIEETMRSTVLEKVKETMVESINEVVYDAYSPTQYKRAKNAGGLTDPNNIDIESYDRSDTQQVMTVKNYRNDFGGRDVAEIVNKGTGYTWKNSWIAQNQPFPRQFYLDTNRRLQESNDIDIALDNALKIFE